MAGCDVQGWDEFNAALGQLPDRIQKNVMQKSLAAGAKPAVAEEKALTNVLSGFLRQSMQALVAKSKTGQWVAYAGIPIKLRGAGGKALNKLVKFTRKHNALGVSKGEFRTAERLIRPFWINMQENGWVDRAGRHHAARNIVRDAGEVTESAINDAFMDTATTLVQQECDKLFTT